MSHCFKLRGEYQPELAQNHTVHDANTDPHLFKTVITKLAKKRAYLLNIFCIYTSHCLTISASNSDLSKVHKDGLDSFCVRQPLVIWNLNKIWHATRSLLKEYGISHFSIMKGLRRRAMESCWWMNKATWTHTSTCTQRKNSLSSDKYAFLNICTLSTLRED